MPVSPEVSSTEAVTSRRDFLRRGLKLGAGLGATALIGPIVPKIADALILDSGERAAIRANSEQRQLDEWAEEDQANIAAAVEANQAKPIESIQTTSGIRLNFYQAQTGWNQEKPITVNIEALNQTVNFMIDSMSKVNDANGQPVDPTRIRDFQSKAQSGQLENVDVTVILSATTGYHTPEGEMQAKMGSITNNHPYDGQTERVSRPIIFVAPDIYQPGVEIVSDGSNKGFFPDEIPEDLPKFSPDANQSMSAYFGHELGHVLYDALGTTPFEDMAYEDQFDGGGEHLAQDHEHISVLPLSWLYNASLAGIGSEVQKLDPVFNIENL